MNLVEGLRMAPAVGQAAVKGRMTFNFRFFPAIHPATATGGMRAFRAASSPSAPAITAPATSRVEPITSAPARKESAGGGRALRIGAHILDLICFSWAKFASEQATLETLVGDRPAAPDDRPRPRRLIWITLHCLQLRRADGTPGTAEFSRMERGRPTTCASRSMANKGPSASNAEDPIVAGSLRRGRCR